MEGLKKYVVSLLGTGALVLIMAGCVDGNENENNVGNNDENNDGSSSAEEVTIDIFQYKVEFRDQFLELAEAYEAENPHVNIEFSAVGGGSDFSTALRSRFSSGDEPDVFSLGGPSDLMDYQDYLLDITDWEVTEAALEGTLSGITLEDSVYGIPYNQEGYGFIYNKTVFEEAGVDPDAILTYEDLEDAVQQIDSQKEELGIQGVFALPGAEHWVMGNHLANAVLAPEFNDDLMEAYNSDTVAFEKRDELQRLLDLQNEYSIQPTVNMDYSQQVEQYFSLGEVAMIQQGDWIYPTLEQMDPEFASDNVGVLPIPVEGLEGKLPIGVPQYWVVNNNSDDAVIEATEDFFNWMYTSEEGIETVQELLSFIPAHESFDPESIGSSLSRDIYEYSLDEDFIGWIFLGYPRAWGDDLGAHMQEYLAGEKEWDDAIEDAISDWEERRQ